MKPNPEDVFLSGLLELQYGTADIPILTQTALSVPWASGWPEEKKAFWNAEAFMWSRKINKEVRTVIGQELAALTGKQNLDLGCGAYSYVPSVGFDLSEKMLDFNENCTEKVLGDVEKKLPFPKESFDSVTAVFLLNYIQKHEQLFREIRRILKEEGRFIMVLSAHHVNPWQRQKEVSSFGKEKWLMLLQEAGFEVTVKEEGNLLFYLCVKRQREEERTIFESTD
ncbi:class I SAM-dependent methyltransferase [Candidatus Woesearchaeota archaeon]|nr:class I SAM-dependent methyltransferase [Candidatus Woesearchaeota archaeon]